MVDSTHSKLYDDAFCPWYHGTPRESALELLDLQFGLIRPPFFLTSVLKEAQYYGRDRIEESDDEFSGRLWVFRYVLAQGARVLDLVTPGELHKVVDADARLALPSGTADCWVRTAGFDAIAYDESELVVVDDQIMRLDYNPPSGEIHLIVVNPAVMVAEAVWKGRAYRSRDAFTEGKWTPLNRLSL